ncbi:MAG TPA: MCE family protein [Mycobacteriales bacterium]|nr:MCE family protein [Mycobacteriales bacterium]
MAPPVRRGRALVAQRLTGLVFLAVLAGLVGLSIASYQKAFTPWTDVVLQADRVGNQLTQGADVKARGVIVGEVESVRATAEGAELRLRLHPDRAARVPADARAQILPKTLFGEKFVSLVFEGDGDGVDRPLTEGTVIAQDRSATAREFSEALDALLPFLQTLEPEGLSTTLNAVSTALRGRGDRIGSNLVLARDFFAEFNPELGRLAANNRGLADFADTLDAAAPDVLALFEDLSVINRNLVRDEPALDRFLQASTGVARTLEDFTRENEQRFITLARESVPNLQVYERYSPQFPCMSAALVEDHRQIANAFGTLQPGLHITLEFTQDNGGYVPGDETEYLDDAGPTCRSLGREGRERPIPEYREGKDGYRDDQEVIPSTGGRTGEPPEGPSGPYTYPDQARKAPQDDGDVESGPPSQGAAPASAATYDRLAVSRAVAPALGVAPRDVPDLAVLLFAPVARGTVVSAG